MVRYKLTLNRNKIISLFSYLFAIAVALIFGHFWGDTAGYVISLGIVSFLLCCLVAYKFRKETSLFICFFFVAYSVYSIILGAYLYPEMRPEIFYSQFKDYTIFTRGLQCLFLYSITMSFLVENTEFKFAENNNAVTVRNTFAPTNWIIVTVCISIIIYLTITNFSFNGTNYRAEGTPLFEYRTVFFVVGILHSGNSKLAKYIWASLVVLSTFISFAGGNRADAIPLLIVYIFFYHNNIPTKFVSLALIAGIFAMISIGAFRQAILSGGFDFNKVITKIWREKFTFDTAYWAYAPSLASIAVSAEDSFTQKIILLGYQALYIIIGGRYSDMQLTDYTKIRYANLGGYVSPTYFYYWIGLFGPVLFALLVYAYIKLYYTASKTQKAGYIKHNVITAMSAYFVAMVPRWFLYGPYTLIRGEMIMLVCIFLSSAVSSFMLYRKLK